MTYETKDMTGSLFTNNRKEKDTHPDRNGSARIDGHDYWVSGWIKQGKDGKPWLSLAFKRKDGSADRPVMDNTRAGAQDTPEVYVSGKRVDPFANRDTDKDDLPF